MKKFLYLSIGLFFLMFSSNVKAETPTSIDIYGILNHNSDEEIIINQDANKYIFTVKPLKKSSKHFATKFDYKNYKMIVEYEDGMLKYVNDRDDSSLNKKTIAYYTKADSVIYKYILDHLESNYLGMQHDNSVIEDKEEYGIDEKLGNIVDYNNEIYEEKIESFSIDVNKFKEKMLNIQSSMKNIKIKKDILFIYNIPSDIKEYIYEYDCGNNLFILLLTKDHKLYATQIYADEHLENKLIKKMSEIEVDNEIKNLTYYDSADYYKKTNNNNICSANLAVKYNNKIVALEYNEDKGYYLNESVKCVEGIALRNEKDEGKEPKIIIVLFVIGLVIIILPFIKLLISKK